MSKIKKLTKAQEAKLKDYSEKWLRIGLATGPCDRPAMEAAVDEAYKCAGLKPPQLKIWLQSPLAGAIGGYLLTKLPKELSGDQVRAQVWDQVWAQVWAQVGAQVGAQVRAQVRDQVRAQVRAQVWDQVGDQVWAQVRAQVGDQVRAQVWDQVCRCGYGSHDANWLAFYEFFMEVCGLEVCGKLRGLNLLAQCGWWWPFEGAVILTERPTQIQRDEQSRLHNDTEAALLYPDGFGIWSIHGVRVTKDIIEHPEAITVKRIQDEQNAEVRRIMINRYGQAKYLLDSGAKVIHSDDFGTLYRTEIPDDEPLCMVKVVNSTPEADGSKKDYFIRVAPTCTKAREAVAWTFGMKEKEYAPVTET